MLDLVIWLGLPLLLLIILAAWGGLIFVIIDELVGFVRGEHNQKEEEE